VSVILPPKRENARLRVCVCVICKKEEEEEEKGEVVGTSVDD
jgi:hypothetical protein